MTVVGRLLCLKPQVGDRDRLGASQKDSENGSVVVGQPQTGAV